MTTQTKYIIRDKTGNIYGNYPNIYEAEYDLDNEFEPYQTDSPYYYIVEVTYTDKWDLDVSVTPSGYYTMQELNGKTFEAYNEDAETCKKIVSDAAWTYFLSLK
jgi:hypothetical protein